MPILDMVMVIIEKSFLEDRTKSCGQHQTKEVLSVSGLRVDSRYSPSTGWGPSQCPFLRTSKLLLLRSVVCVFVFLFLNGNDYFGYFFFYHMCLSSIIFIMLLNLRSTPCLYLNTISVGTKKINKFSN